MRLAFVLVFACLFFPFISIAQTDSVPIQYPVLWEHLNTQLNAYPQSTGLRMNRSLIAHVSGSKGIADDVLREYQQRGPEVLWQWGYFLVRKNHPEIATQYFEKAVQEAPRQPEPYIGLGGCLVMQEKYTEAVEVLEKALWMSPDDRRYWHLLAQAYNGSGQPERMLKNSQRVDDFVKSNGELLRLPRPWYFQNFPFESNLRNIGRTLVPESKKADFFRELALFYDELEYQNESCEAAVNAHKEHHDGAFEGLKSFCGNLQLNTGDQLVYDVNFYGKTYEMQLSLLEYGKGQIVFEWEDKGNNPAEGSVQIAEQALKEAKAYVHILKPNEVMTMKESTSRWLSASLFARVKEGKSIALMIEGGVPGIQVAIC